MSSHLQFLFWNGKLTIKNEDKTTYTATFTDSGKLKGKKIKIGICTYNDPQVGGYGKVYKKKVKVE